MLERVGFEYVVIRLFPRVERGECLNVGVILICRPRRFLQARVSLDHARLRALAPFLDDDTIALINRQLELILRICAGDVDAGPIASLNQSERWHWLAAPSSTIMQPGPVHSGLSFDPAATLEHLFDTLVAFNIKS